MQDIIIRDTTVKDLLPLRTMHGQSWRDTYPNEAQGVPRRWVEERTARWVTPEGLEESKEHVKDIYGHPDHFHKVATDKGEIVGVVHVSKTKEKQHLEALYIAKEYYGTGLARLLMDEALEWSDPDRPIDLQVVTYNERAKAFYRKYGFEEVPGTEAKFAEVIPVITMKREGKSMSLPEEIVASGKLFELVHETQPDGRVFEKARRAPGVRLIIVDQPKRKVLLTKEFRKELEGWDYRLPGGKVFDSLSDYDAHRQSGAAILEAATKKAREEAAEEAGIAVSELDLFRKSTLGATVEWDLYVFEVSKWSFSESGQQLEEGEMIEAVGWFGYEEIEAMIMRGDMQEDRIALILLQWIAKQKESTK